MGIKVKYTDPALNEFATDDVIINVQSGSLFFKSNTKLFKLQGDDQSTTDISDSLIITGLINSRGPKYTVELDGNHDSGPRINMGTSPFNTSTPNDSDLFMSFGAYGSINNLDTKNRDFHLYGTNTTTGFYFDESEGNFGIGTTTPTAPLHVEVDDDTNNSLVEILHLERHADDLSISSEAEGGYIGLYVDDDNFGGELARISWRADNANNYEGDGRIGFWTAKSTSGDQGGMALTEKMTLTRDGYVGIGTTTPTALLHLGTQGSAASNTDPSLTRLALTPPAHTGGPWNFVTRDSVTHAFLDIDYGVTNKITINSDGYVGIGTTSPSHLLEINTETTLGEIIGNQTNLLRLQCEVDHTHNLDFSAIRTEAGSSWQNSGIRIQSKVDSTYQGFIQFNGNGIDHGLVFGAGSSTTSPESILPSMHIDSSNYVNIRTLLRMKSSTTGVDGMYLQTNSVAGMPGQFEALDGTDYSETSLTAGGVQRNLIYFYDSPGASDPGRIVHETSGVVVSGGTDYRNKSTIHLCPGDDNSYYDYVSVHGYDETENIKFRTDGNIEYSGTITDTSDIRLKKNIKPLNKPLEKILKLEGKSFNWKNKDDDNTIHGLIAQEVLEVIPEIVREMPKNPEEKDPMLGITYIDLIPFLIESIKDQQNQIDELKKQING